MMRSSLNAFELATHLLKAFANLTDNSADPLCGRQSMLGNPFLRRKVLTTNSEKLLAFARATLQSKLGAEVCDSPRFKMEPFKSY